MSELPIILSKKWICDKKTLESRGDDEPRPADFPEEIYIHPLDHSYL